MTAGFKGLRVCVVGPQPPPPGGMAAQTAQLCELLKSAQAEVRLVQTNAPYRPAIVGAVPVLRAFFRLLPYIASLWRNVGRSDVMHVMANSGWSWHLFAAPAVWVARARGVPAVVNYRGGEAAQFLARQVHIVRNSLERASALIVPSGFLEQIFLRHGFKSLIVPNVIDLALFSPGDNDSSAFGDAPHLIVARNLEPIYDNATAIRAFAVVQQSWPKARLTLAGIGPERRALELLADELGVRDAVHFAGRLDRAAMAALVRRSHVSLNPSLVDNMPNSVLEALASGVPVVSTSVGGVPYVVDHDRTALLVPPGAPAAMADAVLRLLGDAELRQRLSEAGLRAVLRYRWSEVAPLLADVYRTVLATR